MRNVGKFGLLAAAAVAGTLTVGACSNTSAEHDMSSMGSSQTSAASAPSTSSGQSAQAHNDADVAFAQGMIPHHQQAVEMSDMLLGKQGIDPKVVTLANQIKAAQGPEIEKMQGWLTDWGVPTTPSPGMPNMSGMPGHDMSGMGGGGMMSQQDMAALQNAQGAEASRLFLTQMIEHHKGAITMARTEVDGGQFPAATEMARSIITSQQQEIDSMNAMLAAM
ncbi:DUF305 domain-containing protein [Mycolicibacterium grossiae]|uniref:DUF305 domain-containing protein n=1 Tax=Mycolicibacterium grossiae TaxID=1552759 RepID=A0A1E8Q7V5_9MYCO|nr:DUF305 domain-containing protein [Mycolicibacterium grossiae]OFJ54592.1 DUF305 domain-containing protein [Mycolicibacterium grossiae]QEM45716.1 DUF305 domain-containing protein [Mycolicibacterium grossiae]